ncbi:hypothetical protein [Streptomyces anulatus]|uniref:hypothetical protein n=1 Tax=Streptomyces anulatus TaxID=1892 RepID=UPI0033EEB543
MLREIATRAVEDAQRKADEERTKAERELHWRAAIDTAMELATHEQDAEILRVQTQPLQEAENLNAYRNAMEHQL